MFKNKIFLVCILIAGILSADPGWALDDKSSETRIDDLYNRIDILEKERKEKPLLDQSLFSGFSIAGGISAGSFYASNPGQDMSDNEFLLSNFLVELSSSMDEKFPVSFVGAFGNTSTPSILDTPEVNKTFDIEYASLTLKPTTGISLEAGLLQPNAGLECTYTYDNKNIECGALASQQPYNAYGVRLGYDVSNLNLYAGYYKKRLDDEEYETNGSAPDGSWEIGLGGDVSDIEFNIYHYHLEGMRALTGALVMWTINNVEVGFDIDYWNWDSNLKKDFRRNYSIGGNVYICPRFDKFSIPVRLEYIDQGKSKIYIDSMEAEHIYTATISPTYNFNEKAYIRFESSYVDADKAFNDKNGNSENNRICLAAEVGYLF